MSSRASRYLIRTPPCPPPSICITRHRGGRKAWGIAEMCSARTSESVIPMRTRHRMFPPRDGAPAHVPVGEGVGGGVVLPRQSEAKRALEPALHGADVRQDLGPAPDLDHRRQVGELRDQDLAGVQALRVV